MSRQVRERARGGGGEAVREREVGREVERIWERGKWRGCEREGGGEGVGEREVEMLCFMITCRCQSGTKSPRGNRAVRCHDSSVDSALL